jgi:hypothetical protein
MRKWPNTPHWQRLVSTCRETHGSRWRTAAAGLVRCEKSRLRAMVDGDMPPVEIKKLDALLIDHLGRYISHLHRRIAHIDNVSRAVMRATNEISTGGMRGKPDPVSEGEQRKFFSDAIAKLMGEV